MAVFSYLRDANYTKGRQVLHWFIKVSTAQVEKIASLRPGSIVSYKSYPRGMHKTQENKNSLKNLEKGAAGDYNGRMSGRTSGGVKTILGVWLLAMEQNNTKPLRRGEKRYMPTFVTLTLPSKQQNAHDDNFTKRRFLDRFIEQLKTRYGVRCFFWRAEPQNNGNIHFHLVVDRFIRHQKLRADWNKIMDDYGYIEAYRAKQLSFHQGGFRESLTSKKWSIEKQKTAYEVGMATNWSNPNTTDIHKIINVDNLSGYLVKYLCKSGGPEKGQVARKIDGRIWGCTKNMKKLKHYVDTVSVSENFKEVVNPEVADYVAAVQADEETAGVIEHKDEKGRVVAEITYLKKPQSYFLKKYAPALYLSYKWFYQRIYNELYGMEGRKSKAGRAFKELTTKPVIVTDEVRDKIVQTRMNLYAT